MKELPYFRFTLQEWQNGTITDMPDSAQGVFINVCCYYWANDCDVTKEMLLKRFKTKTKTIQKLIKNKVIKEQNGIIMVSFLNKQLTELNEKHSFFSECGKKGQEAKKKKAPLKPPLSEGLNYKDKIRKDNIKEDKIRTKLGVAVDDFEEMRKKIKKPLTENAKKLLIDKLKKLSSDEKIQIEILNQSTMNSWQGIFPLDDNKNRFKKKTGVIW